MNHKNTQPRVALIGFGEAGGIIGHDLASLGVSVCAYDRLLDDALTSGPLTAKADASQILLCASIAEAVAQADWIISAVTAGSALAVAEEASASLKAGQLFIDINSVAPNTKRAAKAMVGQRGAHYIDAAVMAPVPPQRLRTPILLGGHQAPGVADVLSNWGMNVRVVSPDIGVASAIKMCRSIMIKGLEALTCECLSTARQYGAEDEVLASLHKSLPHMGWDGEQPSYLISRIAEHGRRRAEEMEEVARTAADVGVRPNMSQATVQAQRGLVETLAEEGLSYADLVPFEWRALVDRLYGQPTR